MHAESNSEVAYDIVDRWQSFPWQNASRHWTLPSELRISPVRDLLDNHRSVVPQKL